VVAVVLLLLAPRADGRSVAASPPSGDPNAHLAAIVARSEPPTYRRLGSRGMAAAAADAAQALTTAGYAVVRHDAPSHVWSVDYSTGHEPLLARQSDGHRFAAESAFELAATTPAEGITCTVRAYDQVGPGECGFVPHDKVSPEWNNVLADLAGSLRTIHDRGGVGAILQGDLEHHALIALKAGSQPLPTVVALAQAGEVVGQVVQLRATGADIPATLHNVIGIRPPADPSQGYVLLQGHLDGWFTAAADNGGGAAAVLAAAERLAGDRAGRGLVVALYDGEEWGLRGSRAFAADLARPEGVAFGECGALHLSDLVAIVNLDAPSAKASDLLGAVPAPLDELSGLVSYRVLVFSEEPTVAALLTTTSFGEGVLGLPAPVAVANPVNGGVNRTDVKWFHEAGIPAAWTVDGYPEYHTTADTLEVVDPADLERVTAAAVDLVRAFGAAPIGRLGGSTLGPPGSAPVRPCEPPPPTAPVAASGAALPATGRPIPVVPALVLLAVALGLWGLRRYPAARS
jgi:hypothetical protein